MTKSKMVNRYSPEVRARADRMVFEHQGSYETQAGAIAAIAPTARQGIAKQYPERGRLAVSPRPYANGSRRLRKTVACAMA